jgi:mono/diheme cytochrome c family protein
MKLFRLCPLILFGGLATAADDGEFFEARVRPVFAKNCYACHTNSMMGGLRLDSAAAVQKGGKSGPPIVPGKPEESLLIQAIRQTHARVKMPPSGKLTDKEIADITEWVKSGAAWPEGVKAPETPQTSEYVITAEQRAFWSFVPVRKPAVPQVKAKSWVRTPIDNFILAKLEEKGLAPARPADKRVLIRRATVDLTGLLPTPKEVDDFLADKSADAFAKVVDRLLASPRYGERWGRHWLDVARYADDKVTASSEEAYANAFRYRDWVIQAFNKDMPYDTFVKAQIAGDLLQSDDPLQYNPALGFYALSPAFMQDERVDATSRAFLGLTVACAQCHNHKFDPIPQRDFYSLQGIFANTQLNQIPLAPKDIVDSWNAQKGAMDRQSAKLNRFLDQQSETLGELLATQTARYMLATRKLAPAEGLDAETLERWTQYLSTRKKSHPYLDRWFELIDKNGSPKDFESAAKDFQAKVEAVIEEKRAVDQRNIIKFGPNAGRDQANVELDSLPIEKFTLHRDIYSKSQTEAGGLRSPDGVLYYGGGKIDRFLSGEWKRRLDTLRSDLADMKSALPPQYPFLEAIKDRSNPQDIRLAIRGDRNNPGEVTPRGFVSILSKGAPRHFTKGSGRLELAEAIMDPENPLTARVMVNRIWQNHFTRPIVETPSNYGQMGARPSNPELLDFLAARFVENKWSIKAMHREIMLSSTYLLSSENVEANSTVDADNRLVWRANWRRLDAESLRDSLLFVAGNLDLTMGGPPVRFTDSNNRRAVYGFVSRWKPNATMTLFDFPLPINTAEERNVTNVPAQRLFLMNSSFVEAQAKSFAKRLTGSETQKVREAYRILFGRLPDPQELDRALSFVGKHGWNEYARVLLNSNELQWVN